MSEASEQQKANLARIRDNQRRSRARRKEYLQELETKYRSCEAVGAEASAEMQAVARKVLDENKRLRRLLRQQGLSDADIDGPEHDELASSPSAAEMLGVMLATRKPCRPSSGCGSSRACKSDLDDGESRRQSCASTPAASMPIAPQHQHQLHAPTSIPQSQDSVPQHRPQQQPLPPQHQSRPASQSQQPIQYQQLSPQQQYYMTPPPPPLPQSSVAPMPHPNPQAPPNAFAHEYPIYAPQPYGYAAPPAQLLDWGMASAAPMSQHATYTAPPDHNLNYASPASGYSTRGSFTSPTPVSMASQDNTSSCYVAADAIRAMNAGAGPEVESALGCRDGAGDCRVNNTLVFDVMDRYVGMPSQQTGM